MFALLFCAITLVVIVTFLFVRDQRYQKKQLKEAANPEQKKYLNIPDGEGLFPQVDAKKKGASRVILDEINK